MECGWDSKGKVGLGHMVVGLAKWSDDVFYKRPGGNDGRNSGVRYLSLEGTGGVPLACRKDHQRPPRLGVLFFGHCACSFASARQMNK
jgi:hypothetical protein